MVWYEPSTLFISLPTLSYFCPALSPVPSYFPCFLFHRRSLTSSLSSLFHFRSPSFYRAMLCIRGTSHGPVFVSLCLSVTSRSSTKTAKRRMTQTPHDTTGTLVFWCQRSPRNSTGITPYGAPNAGGVGQNRRLSTIYNRLYLENGKR